MKFLHLCIVSLTLLLVGCKGTHGTSAAPSDNSMTFFADLSTKNIQHRLYQPHDKDVPHPVKAYDYMSKDPVYPYEEACGTGAFLYDPERNELHYAIVYSGLSGIPIMMHFHLGGPRVSGPIIQTIFGEPFSSVKGLGDSPQPPLYGDKGPQSRAGFITGVYKLEGNKSLSPPLSSSEEKEKLMQGEIYVNIHTYLNELGEIRGQIMPCKRS